MRLTLSPARSNPLAPWREDDVSSMPGGVRDSVPSAGHFKQAQMGHFCQAPKKKLLSDDPRGARNGLAYWWFSVSDAVPITLALADALPFARPRRPVSLLRLPPRPGSRLLPARLAAITLPRPPRTKPLLTTFEQTPSGPRPAPGPLAPAALLIFGMACRTLGRAHGRSLLPEAPAPEGIALLSGAQQIFGSIRSTTLSQRSDAPRPRL